MDFLGLPAKPLPQGGKSLLQPELLASIDTETPEVPDFSLLIDIVKNTVPEKTAEPVAQLNVAQLITAEIPAIPVMETPFFPPSTVQADITPISKGAEIQPVIVLAPVDGPQPVQPQPVETIVQTPVAETIIPSTSPKAVIAGDKVTFDNPQPHTSMGALPLPITKDDKNVDTPTKTLLSETVQLPETSKPTPQILALPSARFDTVAQRPDIKTRPEPQLRDIPEPMRVAKTTTAMIKTNAQTDISPSIAVATTQVSSAQTDPLFQVGNGALMPLESVRNNQSLYQNLQFPSQLPVAQTAANAGKIAEQISVQISVQIAKTANPRIEIRLDPPELGRVIVSLSPSDTGIQATITAERPEIVDLMRRHSELLAAAFEKSGFGASEFTFQSGQNGRDDQDDNFHDGAPSEQAAPDQSSITNIYLSGSALDIRL